MAVLGEAYRIMYISAGRTSNLTDVSAYVLKPDLSQAGIFQLVELSGLFRGCYYYDYLSSTSDPEGQYFSRVVSPSESIEDIVRFQLLPGSGDGSSVVIPPTNIVAQIMDSEITARITDDKDLWAYARVEDIRGKLTMNERVVGVVNDSELAGDINSNSTIAVLDR